MRQPLLDGWSPEPSSSTPACASSSWYFAIAPMSFSSSSPLGNTPASESWVALTRIMKRMVLSFRRGTWGRSALLRLRLDLGPQPLLLRPRVRGELGAEVLGLEDGSDLDVAGLGGPAVGHAAH